MEELSVKEFVNFMRCNNNALIVGNGFSINFDSDFKNIYSLASSRKSFLDESNLFTVSRGARPETEKAINTNYSRVKECFSNYDSKSFDGFFNSAIEFADFLKQNQQLKELIVKNKNLNSSKYVPNLYEIAEDIADNGMKKGYTSINIENWSVLIWLYYMVENEEVVVEFAEKNLFLELIKIGDNIDLGDGRPSSIILKYKFNGLNIYMRNLFLTAVFNEGKAVDLRLLENYDSINYEFFKEIKTYFSEVYSLNYDLIIDRLLNIPVTHLHGEFSTKNKLFYYYMNLKFPYNYRDYSTSNILLGNFTLSKMIERVIHKQVVSKQYKEVSLLDIEEYIKQSTISKNINHFVFFGVHPENDFHIFKSIYDSFLLLPDIENTQITFCYFNENEKQMVLDMLLKALMSTGKDIIKTALSKIKFVDSKEIIKMYNNYNQKVVI